MRSSNARLHRVDDLRAVAACLVLVAHAALLWMSTHSGSPGPLETYLGRMGVAIFFVISGLVIYRPFIVARMEARRIDWAAYVGRRLVRICPAYLLAASVYVYVVPFSPDTVQPLNPWVLLGLGQIYTRATFGAGLPVAWTLCIEVTFYLVVPFLALAVTGRRQRFELWLLLGLAVGATVIRLWLPGVVSSALPGYFAWFAIGMLLARMSCRSPRPLPVPAWTIWLVVALGYIAVALRMPGVAWDCIGLGLLAGIAVLPAVTHVGRSYLSWLGDRSYGVYLWHYPVFMWLSQQPQIPLATYIVGGTMLTILAAHGSYCFLERPLVAQLAKAQRVRRRGAIWSLVPQSREYHDSPAKRSMTPPRCCFRCEEAAELRRARTAPFAYTPDPPKARRKVVGQFESSSAAAIPLSRGIVAISGRGRRRFVPTGRVPGSCARSGVGSDPRAPELRA